MQKDKAEKISYKVEHKDKNLKNREKKKIRDSIHDVKHSNNKHLRKKIENEIIK